MLYSGSLLIYFLRSVIYYYYLLYSFIQKIFPKHDRQKRMYAGF